MVFQVGQRVRLNLLANPPQWYRREGCLEGIITRDTNQQSLEVRSTVPGKFTMWYIDSIYLERIPEKEEQLLFNFMEI